MSKKLVLFCDFDGTITEKDNIVAIVKKFAPPEWEALTKQILSQQISVQEGVGKLFQLLPSSLRQDIVDYIVQEATIRPGFADFVRFCREEGIELLITSGGIDFFVQPILAPFDLSGVPIYCNGSDFSGENITITWPHSCDEQCTNGCGMCKTTIIRRYDPATHYRVVIGDSITDLAGAKIADYVIARSFLAEKAQELALPHSTFATFHDVIGTLTELKQEVV
ncbi:2-hydroxy-3-keto-5-methylthiopentenyl-1-phosphate phosphatase [Brevibacillus agri]|uniref:2-hydroxy-3-keto-5-methylthiopentenyl-1-phosphate phosphatase n=1 Tax=Brevibacillus agri TaxID=51101 RepID=A0A3M8ARY5_9BACL|nr:MULTISPECIES: 2-hydroxy-3-keto-5-methylthiopentenyl-1-phosphate phosphatase [Brevibacillus]ELK44035.1 2-hydroxy-3-keto-5-methylthiopentenyl-1-phosphate phosphatase [Brevibacillus agri BAB-2500]EJL47805.1 haloacid dehalogenase superfamily protein, phosphoserine phosphatase/phosphopentane phosphatase [Brevibacillus sp. CF112]MBG9568003.1 2-hydroxy-3-keto-5-methylthiopentenyl-1-phosphate phosphatase [Brevibacillus agri]MDN4095146.1 2-hydroxy-3-keto-5-methylthiopentenyl-1-phosphate phosphatase [